MVACVVVVRCFKQTTQIKSKKSGPVVLRPPTIQHTHTHVQCLTETRPDEANANANANATRATEAFPPHGKRIAPARVRDRGHQHHHKTCVGGWREE